MSAWRKNERPIGNCVPDHRLQNTTLTRGGLCAGLGAALTTALTTSFITLMFGCVFSVPVSAANNAAIQPGEYVTAGGWGTLDIKRAKPADKAEFVFSIEAVAGNGHSCSLEGAIRDGIARLSAFDENKPCVVSFSAKANVSSAAPVKGNVTKDNSTAIAAIEVQERSEPSVCRYFCGARADFNGTYVTPPPGCRPTMIRQSQDSFLKAYQRKDYARAESWLAPILANCKTVLWTFSEQNIRNDLAITYYHLGQRAACLQVLAPMQAILGKSEAQIREEYPPTDADNMLEVRKAGLTNRRLCESLSGR